MAAHQVWELFHGLQTSARPDGTGLKHDIYFWLGSKTTQDESATAAYKTVELDDHLGTARGEQHRELQGLESDKFLAIFHNHHVTYLDGGIESGWVHVKSQTYEPRLLHITNGLPAGLVYESKTHNHAYVRVTEVKMEAASLNLGDAFILDLGLELVLWCHGASVREKQRAQQVVQEMREARQGHASSRTIENPAEDATWCRLLGVSDPNTWVIPAQAPAGPKLPPYAPKLLRVSDSKDGTLTTEQIGQGGHFDENLLTDDDVFLVDEGSVLPERSHNMR
jgi:gelsolin